MKELQAKAKVTQTMTRDGLVVENQADGTVENVSSREAEQDYSTDAEDKAEKILERAEDVKDKHKAKKKAKQAVETAESEDGLHGSAARLELTEEERADPELQPFIQKAEKKADKLDAARAALPKKRVPVKEKVYDAASGKAKSTLRFEQQDKGPPSLKPAVRYGLDILAEGINDMKHNETRFIAVSKTLTCQPEDNRIEIAFHIPNASGTLITVLDTIAHYGIDMTEIHSRPLKDSPWCYVFYVDFTGNMRDHAVQSLLYQLHEELPYIKVIGSYCVPNE